eukprot:TRINITY_DN15008_c0_g1_i1.p1 TRINITY_DN15008_c0_g1~~TRINITY_DN15008_c0_g1_i1.p1  ORF type:complete len:179 (+),score=23.94 TRINITY_DN15008_c0_g1_i1:23-559(+)
MCDSKEKSEMKYDVVYDEVVDAPSLTTLSARTVAKLIQRYPVNRLEIFIEDEISVLSTALQQIIFFEVCQLKIDRPKFMNIFQYLNKKELEEISLDYTRQRWGPMLVDGDVNNLISSLPCLRVLRIKGSQHISAPSIHSPTLTCLDLSCSQRRDIYNPSVKCPALTSVSISLTRKVYK